MDNNDIFEKLKVIADIDIEEFDETSWKDTLVKIEDVVNPKRK